MDMPIIPCFLFDLGTAEVTVDGASVNNVRVVDDSAWVLAFQCGLSTVMEVNKNWARDVALRVFLTTDPDLKDTARDAFDTEYETYNLGVCSPYRFWATPFILIRKLWCQQGKLV